MIKSGIINKNKIVTLFLTLSISLLFFSSCSNKNNQSSEIKNISVIVIANSNEEKIDITTYSDNLRQALEEKKLIEGIDSQYGLFVNTVNSIKADESKQEWWCLTKNSEMWNYGVDDTIIENGDVFEFTLTVGY